MTIATEALTASPAFLDAFNPAKAFKKGLEEAFKQDALAIYFMYSEPPTEAELTLGIQVIDIDTLPHPPVAHTQYVGNYTPYRFLRGSVMAVAGHCDLDPAKWGLTRDNIATAVGGEPVDDPASALSLTPRAPDRDVGLIFGSSTHKAAHFPVNDVRVSPFKWAFIANRSFKSIHEDTWLKHNDGVGVSSARVLASQLIFDFRGTIPLTVGAFGSAANVWLGNQTEQYTSGYGYYIRRPDTVRAMRLNVPNPS